MICSFLTNGENLKFTYQKTPFENFCDLWFSRKQRKFEIFFDGLLHISCMGWEVKNDMSGQSKDALRVCDVKIRKSLMGQNGACLRDALGYDL